MRAASMALLFALAPAVLPLGAAGAATCPVAPPTVLVQDDAGSGRDAGPTPAGAVPLARDGLFWGTLDPPAQHGFADTDDWYAADVPPGARDVTVEIKSLGKLLAPNAGWPFVYWLEVFRPGVGSVAFRGSWEDPVTFPSPGGERLLVSVYIVPFVWEQPCTPAGGGDGLAAPPPEPQLYRMRFACAPACFA